MKVSNLQKIGAILFWLIIWQIASVLVGQTFLLVSPIRVLQFLAEEVLRISFWQIILHSFLRIVVGFLSALAVGSFLAVLSSRVGGIKILLWPLFSTIKATPVASFIILCLIWISSSRLAAFTAFLMVLPIIYVNILQGIESTDKKLLEMARVFNMTSLRQIKYIFLPQIRPYLFSACQVSLGLSWKAGIAAEVIGIPRGSIGERLYVSKLYLNTQELFAWTLVIVLISILFEKVFMIGLKKLYAKLERSRYERSYHPESNQSV